VVEPKHAGKEFESAMDNYKAAVKQGRGALMFAVCRGKVRICSLMLQAS